MSPFTACYVVSVVKGVATYGVAWVRDGRTLEPTGHTFESPRAAARFADRLERRQKEVAA